MKMNYSEELIGKAVGALQELLKLEGDIAEGVTLEGTHGWVVLYQAVPEGFDVKALRALKTDAQKIGMKWCRRIMAVRLREMGWRGQHFPYNGYLRETACPYVEFTMHLSPLDALYYLERHHALQESMAWRVPDGMLRVFTIDGRGAIPIGARLRLGRGTLEMVGSDVMPGADPDNPFNRVHPLTVSLMSESLRELEEYNPRSDWRLEEDWGGALLLSPIVEA